MFIIFNPSFTARKIISDFTDPISTKFGSFNSTYNTFHIPNVWIALVMYSAIGCECLSNMFVGKRFLLERKAYHSFSHIPVFYFKEDTKSRLLTDIDACVNSLIFAAEGNRQQSQVFFLTDSVFINFNLNGVVSHLRFL